MSNFLVVLDIATNVAIIGVATILMIIYFYAFRNMHNSRIILALCLLFGMIALKYMALLFTHITVGLGVMESYFTGWVPNLLILCALVYFCFHSVKSEHNIF